MCEIQFMKRMDGKNLDEKDLNTFVKFMSLGDIGNSDAFGFFNSKKNFKSPGKFNYRKLNSDDIISDKFVVGHNRFATKRVYCIPEEIVDAKDTKNSKGPMPNWFIPYNGSSPFMGLSYNNIQFFKENPQENPKDKKERKSQQVATKENEKPMSNFNDNLNNHPFELSDLVLVHNGVVHNVDSLIEKFEVKTEVVTDSFIILFLIDKFLKESKGKEKDRTKLMIEAIKKTTQLIKGWYSVFLFDRKEEKLYYFKDNLGLFYFYKPNKNLLLGSTNYSNFEYVYKVQKIFKDLIIPKPGRIYLIRDEKDIKNPLKEIGVFRDYVKKAPVKKKPKKKKKSHFLKRSYIKLKGGKK